MEKKASLEEHLERWKRSGLSRKEYCRVNGLSYSTFLYRLKRSGGKTSPSRNESPAEFVALPSGSGQIGHGGEFRIYLNLGFFRLEYTRRAG